MDEYLAVTLVAVFVLPLYPLLWKMYYKIGKLEGRLNARNGK